MKKLITFIFAIALTMAIPWTAWGETYTWEGNKDVWKNQTKNDVTITVSSDGSNSSKKIDCISNSNQAYFSLNGKGRYLKFAAPTGYQITNIKIIWMSGAANQQIPILFGKTISAVGTVESKDNAVSLVSRKKLGR